MIGWDRDQNSFCLLCHSGPLCWGIPSHDIWSDIKWYGMQNTQTNQMVTGPLAFLKIFIIPCSYFLLQNFTSFDRPTSLIGSSNLLELLRVRTCSCFPKNWKFFKVAALRDVFLVLHALKLKYLQSMSPMQASLHSSWGGFNPCPIVQGSIGYWYILWLGKPSTTKKAIKKVKKVNRSLLTRLYTTRCEDTSPFQ